MHSSFTRQLSEPRTQDVYLMISELPDFLNVDMSVLPNHYGTVLPTKRDSDVIFFFTTVK